MNNITFNMLQKYFSFEKKVLKCSIYRVSKTDSKAFSFFTYGKYIENVIKCVIKIRYELC